MRTSVFNIEDATVVVSKFDNSEDFKAFTADELEHYVSGIIGNYSVESDEEEALLALMQGFKAMSAMMEEGEVSSCSA